VLKEVVDEFAFSASEESRIRGGGIHVLTVSKKHLEKLKEVLSDHGDNLQLLNLYECKGAADIVMVAYILAESQDNATLFAEEYTLVTKDAELISVAESYGIKCAGDIEQLSQS
jgi:hypothetical protein